MTKELSDRIETFEYMLMGYCRNCCKSINANIGSDCTARVDKVRFYYPFDNTPSCLFRCECGEPVKENFVSERAFH